MQELLLLFFLLLVMAVAVVVVLELVHQSGFAFSIKCIPIFVLYVYFKAYICTNVHTVKRIGTNTHNNIDTNTNTYTYKRT